MVSHHVVLRIKLKTMFFVMSDELWVKVNGWWGVCELTMCFMIFWNS